MTTLTTNADEPNDDQRHSRDLWAEEDIGSVLERLHNQVVRIRELWYRNGALNAVADADLLFAGDALTGRRRPAPGRTATIATSTPGPGAAREGVR